MTSHDQLTALQNQIVELFKNIQKIKQELASIKHPDAKENFLGTAADQLQAISEETTKATSDILSALEAIQNVNDTLTKEIKFGGARPHFDRIADNINLILEACVYHDITGQRLARITRTINAVEGGLNSLVFAVGKDGFSALPVTDTNVLHTQDERIMEGPKLRPSDNEQQDIDRFFPSLPDNDNGPE